MSSARRLALPAALVVLALLPAGAAASETCTTLAGARVAERPSATPLALADSPLAANCAAAVLSISPLPVLPGATVTLDGSQSVGGDLGNGIAHYVWSYGDGSPDDTTDPPVASVTHSYARGPHTATLTILDDNDAVLDATSVPFVADTPPTAALQAPAGTLRPGATYGFDASASAAPDPGGSLVRYDWSWGDGTTTTDGGPAAQHAFASDGASSQVTVTVYDDLGVSASASAPVTVANELPLVQLVATPSTVQVGEQLRLDASGSSDPDGAVVEYRWDLDANGSFETSTGTTPFTTAGGYPNPGPLTLRVKVIDDSGGSSVKGVVVTVANPPSTGGGSPSGGAGGSGDGSGSGGSGTGSSGGAGGGASGSDPFAVGLSGAAIQKLKTALRRGVGLQAFANRTASGRLTMTVTARDAKTLHLPGRKGARPVAIGRLELSLRAGRTAKPAIKLTAAAARVLRRAKPRTLRVTIRGSLAAGQATAAVVRVVLLQG